MLLWELTAEEQNRIIQRLIQERFLDELRYAIAFAKDKSKFAKWGRVKVEFELRKKKISEAVISKAVSELKDEDCNRLLTDLLVKKNKQIQARNDYDRRNKLIRYGLGKGYQMDEVIQCLNALIKGNGDLE